MLKKFDTYQPTFNANYPARRYRPYYGIPWWPSHTMIASHTLHYGFTYWCNKLKISCDSFLYSMLAHSLALFTCMPRKTSPWLAREARDFIPGFRSQKFSVKQLWSNFAGTIFYGWKISKGFFPKVHDEEAKSGNIAKYRDEDYPFLSEAKASDIVDCSKHRHIDVRLLSHQRDFEICRFLTAVQKTRVVTPSWFGAVLLLRYSYTYRYLSRATVTQKKKKRVFVTRGVRPLDSLLRIPAFNLLTI